MIFDRLYRSLAGGRTKQEADELYLNLLQGRGAAFLLPLILDLFVTLSLLYGVIQLSHLLFPTQLHCVFGCFQPKTGEVTRCCSFGVEGVLFSLVLLITIFFSHFLTTYYSSTKLFLRSTLVTALLEILFVALVFISDLPFFFIVPGCIVLFLACFLSYRTAFRYRKRKKGYA